MSGDQAEGTSERMPEPADLAIGAFSEQAPWLVDPDAMPWRQGIDQLRKATRAQVPVLLRRRRLPPGQRVAITGLYLGSALASWYLRERGTPASRAGLSRRLRQAFEKLGPTYIKLGQILSSGEDIFPPELVGQMRLLRDRVPAEPFPLVRRTLEEELGRPPEQVFSHISTSPLAAASIAQVYPARLRTGEDVVIKVQRSRVAKLVRDDLAAMSWIAPALVGRIPVAALANPPALIELFAETIVEELDFRLEAQNMLDVAKVLAETGSRALIVPRPHPELVTKRMLVMERLSGFAWDDVASMRKVGIDTTEIVRAGMIAFMEGAMIYGVFHGDLHGGNLLVRPDGKVVLLDYGITGRLEEPRRLAFMRLVLGGTMNDVRLQMAALRDLGALPPDTDLEAVIRDLGLEEPFQDPLLLTPEELAAQIRDLTRALLSYGARLPKELMLFVKNMLFVNATMATFAPELDLFAEIGRITEYFRTRYGDRIAKDTGIDPRSLSVDYAGLATSLGLPPDTTAITYKDLQERRELIRRRMQERQARSASRQRRKRLLERLGRVGKGHPAAERPLQPPRSDEASKTATPQSRSE